MRHDRFLIAAVGVGRVDLEGAVGAVDEVEDEGDAPAVGRPAAVEVRRLGVGLQEGFQTGAVRVHDPKAHMAFVNARHQEVLAVGRPTEMFLESAVRR